MTESVEPRCKDTLRQRPRLSSVQIPSEYPYRIVSSYGLHDDEIYTPFDQDHGDDGYDEDEEQGEVRGEGNEAFPSFDFNEIPESESRDAIDLPNRSIYCRKQSIKPEQNHRRESSAPEIGPRKQSVAVSHRMRRRSTAYSQKPPKIVTWNDIDDPENPRNWSIRQKWIATVIVSLFTFMAPVASSMVAPSLMTMAADLGVTSMYVAELMLSIFVLGFAIGPLCFGGLSEIYGRVRVLQWTNLFFIVFNLACGFAQTSSQMLALRFLSGVGGSAAAAIGGGVLGDCWWPEQRGKAVAAYSLAPLLGPAVGPIVGGFVAQSISWRWVFWISSIGDACIQLFSVFFLQETYGPELLHRRAKKLRRETGNKSLRTEYECFDTSIWVKITRSLLRPFRLLLTQPIIQVLSIYMACIYGLTYLVYASFPRLWMDEYGESMGIAGLNYISLSIGFFMGTQIIAPLNDRIYRILKKRNDGVGKPEYRCPVMIPGSILVAIGLFWYGWSAEAHLHWIMPDMGMIFFSVGCDIGFQAITTYIVDSYTRYAASGIAATIVLRSIAGSGFPLFAPIMFTRLGYGWANSTLGLASLGLGLPAPFLLWKYGPFLRKLSPFAAGD